MVSELHPWRNYSFVVGYSSPVGVGEVWAYCPTDHCWTLEGGKLHDQGQDGLGASVVILPLNFICA